MGLPQGCHICSDIWKANNDVIATLCDTLLSITQCCLFEVKNVESMFSSLLCDYNFNVEVACTVLHF